MKILLTSFLTILILNTTTLFDFSSDSNLQQWYIVNDTVMGGKSDSRLIITSEGHGLFTGKISLENNGGFSSVHYRMRPVKTAEDDRLRVRLKGDGKTYQLRAKYEPRFEYAYIYEFRTTGEWQEIEVSLSDMYPVYRGRIMNRPNFEHDTIEEVIFLIGNNRPENFSLLIDRIELTSD